MMKKHPHPISSPCLVCTVICRMSKLDYVQPRARSDTDTPAGADAALVSPQTAGSNLRWVSGQTQLLASLNSSQILSTPTANTK